MHSNLPGYHGEREDYGEEDDEMSDIDVEPCGAVHPNYPNIRCVRYGKCPIDDHLGILEHKNGYREYVIFGKAAEEMSAQWGGTYKLLKIYPDKLLSCAETDGGEE